jgi:hypothetical protein
MLEIRYSAPGSLDISASVDELRRVRLDILKMIQSDTRQNSFEADSTIHPAPYDYPLSNLVIVKKECPARVSLKGEKEILVEGSPDCLEAFASFFEFESDAEKGSHAHFEHYQGNDWIATDSIPLVIRVK